VKPPLPFRAEADGWSLEAAIPSPCDGLRDELIRLAVATANGRSGAPLRRSRRATTYNPALTCPGRSYSLFVKVLDPPASKPWRIRAAGRVAQVARITARLMAIGFEAPPVWMTGREPATGRELLVTPRAEGRGPLRTLAMVAGSLAHKRAILRALGAEIARLHRAGFVHGDLTPFNIFIVPGEPPRFVFLDHERTRRIFLAGRRRYLRNLVQLGRFRLPGVSRTDRMRVAQAYCNARRWRGSRKVIARIAAMLGRRIARDGGLAPVTR
jgi:hypothetical protein